MTLVSTVIGFALWWIVFQDIMLLSNAFKALSIMQIEFYSGLIKVLAAAIGAYAIVVALKHKDTVGWLIFKGFGFQFEGVAVDVILWLMCFMGISLSIKLLS